MLQSEILIKLEQYFMWRDTEAESSKANEMLDDFVVRKNLIRLVDKLYQNDEETLDEWFAAVENMLYEIRVDRKAMQLRVAKHVLRYPQRYDEQHDFGDKTSLAAKVCSLYNIAWEINTLRAWGFVLLPDFFHLFHSYDNVKNLAWLKEYVKQNETR
jgi:hypothetical protein